jgi:predicted nucleic acid-binding Zn finger protein
MPVSGTFEEIREKGLTEETERKLVEEFGARGKKAVELVKAGRVRKYKDFFVVQGSKGEYIVEDDFCTCNDYLFRLSIKGGVCYHSIAVRIAEAIGLYETVDEWYVDVLYRKVTKTPRA